MTGSMGAMRRLPLLALLVALTGILVGVPTGSSYAAPGCPPFNVNSAVRAPAIFDGRVTSAPRVNRALRAVMYSVQVQTSLKGTARGTVAVALVRGPCSLGRTLKLNEDYYFFVNPNARGTGWVAPGTAPTVVPYTEPVTQQLHALLDRPSPTPTPTPTPTPVTFARPTAGEPSSFTRVAAPGAALVIIGLLGYLVVRRLGRRTP